MPGEEFRYFEFGEFRLDSLRRTLKKNGEDVRLTPRIFDLLHVLVQNEGRIMTHDELLDTVWDGAFVEQSNLKKSVSALRQALGESPNAGDFINTVPRKGYRFISPVRAFADEPETIVIRETRAEITVEEQIEEDPITVLSAHTPLALEGKKRSNLAKFTLIPGAFLLLAVVAFSAFYIFREPDPSFSVERVKTTKLIADGTVANVVSVSGDGKYLVYAVIANKNTSLVLRQLGADSVRTLVPPQPDIAFWGYNFTPDNEYVFYIVNDFAEPSKSGLYKIPFSGGTPKMIFEKAGGYVTFSPDGKRVAFTRRTDNFHTEIVSTDTDGNDVRSVKVFDEKHRIWGVAWAPDGNELLCTIRRQDGDKTVYYVSEVSVADGGEKVVVPEQSTNLISAVWLPDKQSLLFSMSEPNAVIRQIWQYFPNTGKQTRVTNDNVSYWFLSLTRDGKTLVTTQETRPAAIWTADSDLSNFRKLTTGTNEFVRAFWTADGKIVYQTVENRQESLWLTTADGSEKLSLASGGDSFGMRPRMSADGRSIAFATARSGTSQIWTIGTDGRDLRQLTDNLNTPGTEAKLLADGQTIVYLAYVSDTGWTLYRRSVGENDIRLTDATIEAWDISPDEQMLAYSATDPETNKHKIVVRDIASGQIVETFDMRASHAMRWSLDGKALYVGSRRDGSLSEIMKLPLDGGEPKIFDDHQAERLLWLDVSPDGKSLLAIRGEIQSNVVLIRAE
jgi:DNA-binding winged helix-turn-helix (wHTH) protein/Tol biopolymer transport system component